MPLATIRQRSIFYTDHPPVESSRALPPIIFVHGLGSSSSYFHPIVPHLTRLGHRCITFDNYGAARSVYLPDVEPGTSIAGIADDVTALLDHCGLSKAVVVGYSMGGLVPLRVASHAPDRIVAGVCLGPVNPENKAGVEVLVKRIGIVEEGGMEPMSIQIPTTAPAKKASSLTRSFIREMVLAQSPAGYIANIRAIRDAPVPDYANIKTPVYIIVGEEDKSCPPEGCRAIFDNLRAVGDGEKKLEVLKDVGHWYCVEEPDKVGKLIGDWIAGVVKS